MSSTLVDDARDRAFERLYTRYAREVHRYVLTLLRNPAEAEDVTQTTFLNAYRAIQAGAEPQVPHNWLIAIAHNACRSRVRFAMRRPREVSLDEVAELAVPEPERLNIRELLRAFGRLPSNQRTALTLREFEGRSYPEIAATLGVTVPAVEALIVRARKTLRRQAGTLRGVLALLPRAVGLGTGAAAKVATVVVVGVVAGSAGQSATGETDPLPAVHAATPSAAVLVPIEAARPRRIAKLHRHVVPAVRHAPVAPARPVTAARPAPEPAPDPAAPPAAAPPAQPASTPASARSPAPSAPPAAAPSAPQQALPVAVPDLPVAVPPPPDPPVALPKLPDPPVELPPLPDPPQLPPIVAQVFPTSGI